MNTPPLPPSSAAGTAIASALTGTFGKKEITAPRARIQGENGKTSEWKSVSLRAYQRRTKAADALIAGAYLAGTNTRSVRRALNAVCCSACKFLMTFFKRNLRARSTPSLVKRGRTYSARQRSGRRRDFGFCREFFIAGRFGL
jgi:hypothetical protein